MKCAATNSGQMVSMDAKTADAHFGLQPRSIGRSLSGIVDSETQRHHVRSILIFDDYLHLRKIPFAPKFPTPSPCTRITPLFFTRDPKELAEVYIGLNEIGVDHG